MPRPQSEALAKVLRDEVTSELVTSADLDAAVKQLEGKIDGEASRLEGKIESEVATLRAEMTGIREQIAHSETRFEKMLLRQTLALILAIAAVMSLLLRFMR